MTEKRPIDDFYLGQIVHTMGGFAPTDCMPCPGVWTVRKKKRFAYLSLVWRECDGEGSDRCMYDKGFLGVDTEGREKRTLWLLTFYNWYEAGIYASLV